MRRCWDLILTSHQSPLSPVPFMVPSSDSQWQQQQESQSVSLADVEYLVGKCGMTLTPEELVQMGEEVGVNTQGHMQREDFIRMLRRTVSELILVKLLSRTLIGGHVS
jgi:hypothetical protein